MGELMKIKFYIGRKTTNKTETKSQVTCSKESLFTCTEHAIAHDVSKAPYAQTTDYLKT